MFYGSFATDLDFGKPPRILVTAFCFFLKSLHRVTETFGEKLGSHWKLQDEPWKISMKLHSWKTEKTLAQTVCSSHAQTHSLSLALSLALTPCVCIIKVLHKIERRTDSGLWTLHVFPPLWSRETRCSSGWKPGNCICSSGRFADQPDLPSAPSRSEFHGTTTDTFGIYWYFTYFSKEALLLSFWGSNAWDMPCLVGQTSILFHFWWVNRNYVTLYHHYYQLYITISHFP